MNLQKLALALFATVLLSGCATIFLPRFQTVSIHTGSDSATVYVANDSIGTGKEIKTRLRRGITTDVTIESPGIQTQHDVLMPVRRKPAFWILQPFNLLSAGIGILYDFTFDKNVSFPSELEYDLEDFTIPQRVPDQQKYLRAFKVSYAEPALISTLHLISANYPKDPKDLMENLEKGKKVYDENLAKNGGVEFQKKQKENHRAFKSLFGERTSCDMMGAVMDMAIGESGFATDSMGVFKDNRNIFQLSAIIDNVDYYEVNGKRWPHYMDKAFMNVTWVFSNVYGEEIGRIQSEGWSGNFAHENRWVSNNPVYLCFADAFYTSYIRLLKSEAFENMMQFDTSAPEVMEALQISKPAQSLSKKQDCLKASVTIKTNEGHGSGFAISEDGYLLTNYHVIASRSNDSFAGIEALDYKGVSYPVKVIRYDKMHDVALLKVEHTFEFAFQVPDTAAYNYLEDVYTIGTPSFVEMVQTISKGLISGIKENHQIKLLQLSMNVNPGNSGGPVFDESLNLKGIIVSKLNGQNTQGICFAVPIDVVHEFLNISYSNQ